MTAELAITLPVVLLILGIVIGGVALSAHRVGITSLASEVARLEARGDHALASSRLAAFPGQVSVRRSRQAGLLCVVAESYPGSGILSAIRVSARGCAAESEHLE